MKRDRARRLRKKGVASWAAVTVMAMMALALAPSTAAAVGILDQAQDGPPDISVGVGPGTAFVDAAQTFTAGITGDLDQLDLLLGRGTRENPTPLTIELQGTSGGTPDGVVWATAVVQPDAVSPFQDAWVPIPIGPVPVTQGTQYAIVAKGGSDEVTSPFGFQWSATSGTGADPYPGGGRLQSPAGQNAWTTPEPAGDADFNFRTYVTPVPPAPPQQQCSLIRLSIGIFGPPIVICI